MAVLGAGPARHHADNAYDHRRCRRERRARGVTPRIARRGIESSTHLGRYRWVVERTFAWLARYHRLTIRHERRAVVDRAFTTLGCALLCLGEVRPFCYSLFTIRNTSSQYREIVLRDLTHTPMFLGESE